MSDTPSRQSRRDFIGYWIGDNLWTCIGCITRNLSSDDVCTNCSRGVRPQIPVPDDRAQRP